MLGVQTQALTLVKQELYPLSHLSSPTDSISLSCILCEGFKSVVQGCSNAVCVWQLPGWVRELHETPTEASLYSFHFGRLGVGLGMCLSGEPAAVSC